MRKLPPFGDLETTLEEFGYARREKSHHQVFEHPEGSLMIVLPKMDPKTEITPTHWKIVEKTIADDQVVGWEDFHFYLEHGKRKEDFIQKGDRLLRTVPGSKREIRVVAASEEDGGMVIIQQKGTFSPCPVSQLRKEVVMKS